MDLKAIVVYISEWLGIIGATWLFSLSPRIQKPPIGFKYARRDGLMALFLYGLILILAFVFYTLSPPIFRDPLPLAPAPQTVLDQALLLAFIALAAFAVAVIVRRQPIRSIGWDPTFIRPALLMGAALAILTIFLHNNVMNLLKGVNNISLNQLVLALGIAAAEETIFRGYIQLRLSWWMGQWPGLVLTALMFALWHMPAWLTRLPMNTIIILVALTFAQGLILGFVMRISRSVLTPTLYRAASIWMQFF